MGKNQSTHDEELLCWMTGPVIQWLPKPALTVNTKLHEAKEKWYKNVGALYIFHAKTPEDSFCKLFASSSTMSWYSDKTRSSIWSRRRRIRSARSTAEIWTLCQYSVSNLRRRSRLDKEDLSGLSFKDGLIGQFPKFILHDRPNYTVLGQSCPM